MSYMQEFLDKQETIRNKRKEIFNQILDLQISEKENKQQEIDLLNEKLEKLRIIENGIATKIEK